MGIRPDKHVQQILQNDGKTVEAKSGYPVPIDVSLPADCTTTRVWLIADDRTL